MKNITVTLDEKMAAWLRLRGVSVSRFLGDLVHEHMREAREYKDAKHQYSR